MSRLVPLHRFAAMERLQPPSDYHPAPLPPSEHSSDSLFGPTAPLQGFAVEPIEIQGNGPVTIFGLNNHFSPEIPNRLITRLAPQEFSHTVRLVNKCLRKNFANNVTWLFCGCAAFCCTVGCSMCPVILFGKRTVHRVKKILRRENGRLYGKLGLEWKLQKRHSGAMNMVEYVIVINFLPRPDIYQPD